MNMPPKVRKLFSKEEVDSFVLKVKNPYQELWTCASSGKVEALQKLLQYGIKPHEADETMGYTALMAAAFQNHEQCARLLLDADANIDAMTDYGNTALMSAAIRGSTECLKLLLERGADANLINITNGFTALMYASKNGFTEEVRLLIRLGKVELTMTNFEGDTAIDLAYSGAIRGMLEDALYRSFYKIHSKK